MPYNYQEFYQDKNRFFDATGGIQDAYRRIEHVDIKFRAMEQAVAAKIDGTPQFIFNNNLLIEEEFKQLFESLKALRRDEEKQNIFWFYCYYCCRMMKEYYTAYGSQDQVELFEGYEAEIKQYVKNQPAPLPAPLPGFFGRFYDDLMQGFSQLCKAPVTFVLSKIGAFNLHRIYMVFCRLSVSQGLHFFRQANFLEKFETLLNKKIDEDAFIKKLESGNFIFNALSVGIFAVRFMINAAMLIKHTFLPSAQEKGFSNNSMKERFLSEMYKRHASFLNDVAWGTVNALTNYPQLINITAPVANWLVAGFLVFDLCLILWQRHLAEKQFEAKNAQYSQDIANYSRQLEANSKRLSQGTQEEQVALFEQNKQLAELIALTEKQRRELEFAWHAKNASFMFDAAGAAFFVAGFTASFLLATPVAAMIAYAMCCLAVAMYMSDKAYGNWREKSLRFQYAKDERLARPDQLDVLQKEEQKALQEYQAARREFAVAMVKNTLMPMLLMATVAICWQAALVLIVVYIGVELVLAYRKNQAKKAPLMVEKAKDNEKVPAELSVHQEPSATAVIVESASVVAKVKEFQALKPGYEPDYCSNGPFVFA